MQAQKHKEPRDLFRIRIHNTVQKHGNLPKFTNKLAFLPFKRLQYLRMYVFRPITYFKYIFHVKIQIFVT